MPALSSAALMAVAPSCGAGTDARAPLKLPTGVRAALTIYTVFDIANRFAEDKQSLWFDILQGVAGLLHLALERFLLLPFKAHRI